MQNNKREMEGNREPRKIPTWMFYNGETDITVIESQRRGRREGVF
jgi:hypothetical protein